MVKDWIIYDDNGKLVAVEALTDHELPRGAVVVGYVAFKSAKDAISYMEAILDV